MDNVEQVTKKNQEQTFQKALEKARAWVENRYFSEASREEINQLIKQDQKEEIIERFYKDLEFGTGGMRSVLGEGLNRINTYTVRRATYALCLELLKQYPQGTSVCLSYDSRHRSFELAKDAAMVLAGYGIKAYLFERLNPVAMLSFAIRETKSGAGIMITASHNPPKYNGLKIFWNDGSQVTPPNDKQIIAHYNNTLDFSQIKHLEFDQAIKFEKIEWLTKDFEQKYFQTVLPTFLHQKLVAQHPSLLKIVYTPIHGAGLHSCRELLSRLGFTDVHIVEEQAQPDGRFPTVKSPNPENPEALKMAVDLMLSKNADIVMGSDPDTDRLGVALVHDKVVHYLSGNQIGILKLHYLLTQMQSQHKLSPHAYFVKTIVTTPLQDRIAEHFKVKTINTLTGFKWICAEMNKMEKNHPEAQFIFATEESFGYLSHPFARDKDGITSVGLMAEIALFYKTKGKNLIQALDDIYSEFGFSKEELLSLDYEGISGSQKIARIMQAFRSGFETTFFGKKFVKKIDYLNDQLDLPKSDVLGFQFEDGAQVYLRPSGTEPKIKFYLMVQVQEGTLSEKQRIAQETISSWLEQIKTLCNDL